MAKKIIIFGHSGFIGTHLKTALSKKDSWSVTGCSLPGIDLTIPQHVNRLVTSFTPDSTLILAAAVKRQFGDTLEVYKQNMSIIENICELLRGQPVKQVIYMSSAAVYGEETENLNISESTPVNPTSYYGISKYAAERLLHKACAENGVTSLVCLRPPLVYGPADQGRTYGPSGFSAAAIESVPITLWGDGTELREFIYIDDLCRVISRLIEIEFSGELNVVSGVAYCFADVITILKEKFPSLIVNTRTRSKPKANNAFDASMLKSLLPDKFQFTSLESGLAGILSKG
jgi:nucleoside-diphosphate-sugar epimerase